MDITNTVFSDPRLTAFLAVVLVIIMFYVRTIKPREAIQYERIKTLLFRVLNPITNTRVGYPLVYDKTNTDDHITSVEASLYDLAVAFWQEGFVWNPLSAEKYIVKNGRHYTVLQVAYRDSPIDSDQFHAFIYSYGGQLHIHGHKETSPADPDGHLTDKQIQGDPDNRIAGVISRLEDQ